LPSGGTGCGGWGDSSVDGKSGTNFALLKDKENRKKRKKMHFYLFETKKSFSCVMLLQL
jgi:hypothetical protein